MPDFENHPLYGIMHPRSIAFWGASNNPTGMGSIQLDQLLSLGFEGPVYPMHLREKTVAGLPAYAHLKDVPGPVDLAILILPTGVVPEILEECGKAGVTRAIIVSAGFGEMGPQGKELQERLVEIAGKYGIHFVGPNCIGVVNPYVKLNTTFFSYRASAGYIGMASQSGSFITQMFVHLERLGLGFSQGFSVGNEAMTDIVDCMEYLGECPNTKVIALYVEAIRRGREFCRVAREVAKKKPIVAYYVGGSESGKRAALSHTGALAGPDRLYDGIFKQCGINRASSIEELFDFCCVLGNQPMPKGNKIAILTHSGGPGAVAADTTERCGLRLSQLAPETVQALTPHIPRTASVRNPIDLTFDRNSADYMGVLPRILLDDEGVDMLFMYVLMPFERVARVLEVMGTPPRDASTLAETFISSVCKKVAEIAAQSGKPVVGASFCNRTEPVVRELQDLGVPVLPSPERAVKALACLQRYAAAKGALLKDDLHDERQNFLTTSVTRLESYLMKI
jgi:acetate---CoA ligase (ADP-forming) subunit alpha